MQEGLCDDVGKEKGHLKNEPKICLDTSKTYTIFYRGLETGRWANLWEDDIWSGHVKFVLVVGIQEEMFI